MNEKIVRKTFSLEDNILRKLEKDFTFGIQEFSLVTPVDLKHKGIIYDYFGEKVFIKNLSTTKKNGKYMKEICHLRSLPVHSNIIRLHGYIDIKSYICPVFEFFSVDLNRWMHSNKTYKIDIWIVAQDILKALGVLHKKEMIHSDIKRDNILFNGHLAKLCDFGSMYSKESKHFSSNDQTIYYCGPEVIFQYVRSFKNDVYSLGIVLNEMVYHNMTGKFYRVDLMDVYRKKKSGSFLELPECTDTLFLNLLDLMLMDYVKRPDTSELLSMFF